MFVCGCVSLPVSVCVGTRFIPTRILHTIPHSYTRSLCVLVRAAVRAYASRPVIWNLRNPLRAVLAATAQVHRGRAVRRPLSRPPSCPPPVVSRISLLGHGEGWGVSSGGRARARVDSPDVGRKTATMAACICACALLSFMRARARACVRTFVFVRVCVCVLLCAGGDGSEGRSADGSLWVCVCVRARVCLLG